MSRTDQDKQYKYCCICREKYLQKTLFCCYNNHYFCPKCYKQDTFKGKEKKCPEKYCSSWISLASQADMIPRKMFPQPDMYSEKKSIPIVGRPISVNSNINNKSIASSGQSLSRKPANCPHLYCNKSVAINSIASHFKYEHQDVPIISAYVNGRNGLELQPNEIKYNEKLCIVLINLIQPENPQIPMRSNSGNPNVIQRATISETTIRPTKPTLILMATRIPCYDPFDNEDEEEVDITGDAPGYDYDACSPEDKIIIWLASNIATKHSYTLAASTTCNNYRIKYYGPVQTLNERDAKKIFEEGRCMILSHYQLMGMTANGQKAFVLYLIVHGEE